MMRVDSSPTVIGIVGPCAAGKSTLMAGLLERGVNARHIAQEHSYVQDMWKKITNPDILIFLDVSYPVTITRNRMGWTLSDYNEQLYRLRHARTHADLYIQTDELNPSEVLNQVLAYLGLGEL